MQKKVYLGALLICVNIGVVFLLSFQVKRQKEAYHMLRSEDGFLFLESISQEIHHSLAQKSGSLQSTEKKLELISSKSIELITEQPFQSHILDEIVNDYELYGIVILEKSGNIRWSTIPDIGIDRIQFESIYTGKTEKKSKVVSYLTNNQIIFAQRLPGGGAIMLFEGAPSELNESIRASFDHLSKYDELSFLVLENSETIFYQSFGNSLRSTLKPMSQDLEIIGNLFMGEPFSRVIQFEGFPVLECVWPIFEDNTFVAMLRIGLTLDFVHFLERDFMFYMVTMLVFIFLLDFFFIYSLVLVRRLGVEGMKLSSILDHIDDGVLILSGNKTIFVNNRFKEICGHRWHEERQKVQADFSKLKIKDKNILLLRSKHDFGTVFIARDITLEDIAEKTRVREQRMLSVGELSSAFAHEIRNPLNTISMLIQRIGFEKTIPRSTLEEHLHIVNQEITRLNQTVKGFINIAKLPQLRLEAHTFNHLLKEIMDFYAIKSTTMDFSITLLDDMIDPIIMMDRDKIKGVFINIIENALEAHATSIILAKEIQNGLLKITLKDDGEGMEHTVTEKAFEIYFTTKPQGSGLGLPHVQRVITAHGGYLTLDSHLKEGTVLTLFFPIQEKENS